MALARPARPLLFALACVVFAIAVPRACFRLLDAAGVEEVPVGLDIVELVDRTLPMIPLAGPGSDLLRPVRVAYFGDSMVVSYPEKRTVPERLEESVNSVSGAPRFRVFAIASPGMATFDYYFLADRVARVRPDLVILHINLSSFSDEWRGTFARPELAGWLEPANIPETFVLPLQWIGLTTDRLLSYVAVVRAGFFPRWHALVRQQARMEPARNLLVTSLGQMLRNGSDSRFGLARYRALGRETMVEGRQRLNAVGHRRRYGPIFAGLTPDHPVLRVLGATLRRFEQKGIPALVYANPTNFELAREVGAYDEDGVRTSMAALEQVVTGAGARFVDLHAIFADEGFRDAAGHLNVRKPGPDAPLLLSHRLARVVLQMQQAEGER